MTKFYNKDSLGFYDSEINEIPEGSIEVSDSDYSILMEGQIKGQLIVPNQSGYPVLQDRPEPTQEQKIQNCKKTAQTKLADTDWSQYPDVAQTLLNQTDFTNYRAAVRGLLINPVPNPTWPDEPKAEWKV